MSIKSKIILILGPPGAGKGTQASKLARDYNMRHLAAGDALREEVKSGSELGKEIESLINKGNLVPSEIVFKVFKVRINEAIANGENCLLDGFPRKLDQAQMLDDFLAEKHLKLSAVINIDIDLNLLVRRLLGRVMCSQCQTTYHLEHFPPKVKGICDKCGGELVQRKDDSKEIIEHRITQYKSESEPLIKLYKDRGVLQDFDGALSIDEVYIQVCTFLEKKL